MDFLELKNKIRGPIYSIITPFQIKKKWKKLDNRRCIPTIDFTFLLIFMLQVGVLNFQRCKTPT